jgi:enoyl-CoA hydratase/carnithine racemase
MTMKNVVLEDRGAIAVLRLAHGVTNAIGPAMVADLRAALREVPQRFRGLVLAGGPKFFSIGLDLPVLLKLNSAEMTAFWVEFEDTVLDLYTLTIPTAAAIAGHAPAAGAILALACDFRLIASGKNLIGLNEIKIGLPVPFLADLMLRQAVGDRAATEIEFTGELLMPEKAQSFALVDGQFPEAEVEARAINKISGIIEGPPFGFPITKGHRTREIRNLFLSSRETVNEGFFECWFDHRVQELLRAASEKF